MTKKPTYTELEKKVRELERELERHKLCDEALMDTKESLKRSHEGLEKRVEERTAQFAKTTETLKAEIEEHKQAEEGLERSDKKYKILIENIPGMVYRGRSDWTTEIISKSEEICGDSTDELQSQKVTWLDIIHPEDKERVFAEASRSQKKPMELVQEYRIIKKDGEIRWVADHKSSHFSEEGIFQGVDGIVFDTSEQKLLEDNLRSAKEEADMAIIAKNNFIGSMSHELRTPLNAIIGFSQILSEKYFGELNEKQEEYVNDIKESGKHLHSLIEDILEMTQIEARDLRPELSLVKIKELSEKSLGMIKKKAENCKIRFELDVPEELRELEIAADRLKLQKIMFNLLSNAVKYTPDGGEISITVNLISDFGMRFSDLKDEEKQSAIRNPNSQIEVSVSDTGIGIAPEDQERIFEAFYQVCGGCVDKTPGAGLGLTLSKRLVGSLGGKIWVESEGEGKGSRFSFSVPIGWND